LRLARKKKWNQIEEKRIREEIELQSYLNRLIQEDKERQIQKIRSETGIPEVEVNRRISALVGTRDKYAAELNVMFSQLDIRRKVCFCFHAYRIICLLLTHFL
jgi:STIP1 family protein 1